MTRYLAAQVHRHLRAVEAMPKNNSMEVTDCPAWDQQPEPIRTRMALATGLPRVQYRQIDVTGKPFARVASIQQLATNPAQ